MPKPISRRELIRRMRILGWIGPEAGKRHGAMRKGNAYGADSQSPSRRSGRSLVKRVIKQANIDPEEWEQLK